MRPFRKCHKARLCHLRFNLLWMTATNLFELGRSGQVRKRIIWYNYVLFFFFHAVPLRRYWTLVPQVNDFVAPHLQESISSLGPTRPRIRERKAGKRSLEGSISYPTEQRISSGYQ